MKIESIIKRANGTKVPFGKTVYHFKPEVPGGPHVAEVADEDHAERLLAIPEGYRKVGKAAERTKPVEPEASTGPQVLQGSDDVGKAGDSQEQGTPAEPRQEDAAPPAKRRGGRPRKAQ